MRQSIGDYRLKIEAGDSIFIPVQNDLLKIAKRMKLEISHI